MIKRSLFVIIGVVFLVSLGSFLPTKALDIDKDELLERLTATKISIPFPEDFTRWPEPVVMSYGGTNTASTGDARGHMMDGVKVIYYKTMVWGNVEASFSDFRTKVTETLNDPRGWVRAGLKFVEVNSGQDVNVILSDPASLGATPGCGADLSCTTWANQVIINDVRWREGTEASRAGGMSTRDYQHMVVNHEMGHWLGHYEHIAWCTEENGFIGGPAPIMLQQSTGLRDCSSFNAWPLDSELWTLR
ncbi:DUF3152 domain-containing protein [Candidatus Saccharibacteria bacterium]|nr:DUF3152 domain-containing protein [Candidatus Saccharibacteria bacterium]